MEQIVLYLAVLAALSGFGMGLMNLAGPYLKRRKITLPRISLPSLLNRAPSESDDDDLDFDDDEDDLDVARDFAEKSFAADVSLLARRRSAIDDGEEELDEELASVLDQVAEEEFEMDEGEAEDEERTFYTVSVEAVENEDESLDTSEDEADDEDDEGYEDDEDEEESTRPEVQTVAAGGNASDDMMSFFNESADDLAKVHLAWRDDIPEVSIEELLAEARAVSQEIKNKKHRAA